MDLVKSTITDADGVEHQVLIEAPEGDQKKNGQGRGENEGIEALRTELAAAFKTQGEQVREEAIAGMRGFARELGEQRSRKAPIPDKGKTQKQAEDEHGRAARIAAAECRDFRVIGDVRDPLYRRMERGRGTYEVEELRACRNPKMDELAKMWAQCVASRNAGGREILFKEMNDRYLDQMGYGRAPLLEGAPNADSGFAAGSGGELLPLPLSTQLIVERDKASKMRGLVNVFPMTTQTQRVPVLPTMSANTRAENAAYADGTPDPDSALLSAKDLGVSFSAGRNFLEDTSFNIANQLTVVAGGAIGA